MKKQESKSAPRQSKSAILPIPDGLKKCPKCGYYKGKCNIDAYKHFQASGYKIKPKKIDQGQEHPHEIDCICNRQICKKCNKPVYKYRIQSTRYDEKDGRFWYAGVICAWSHRCGKGKQLWEK